MSFFVVAYTIRLNFIGAEQKLVYTFIGKKSLQKKINCDSPPRIVACAEYIMISLINE